MKKGVIPIELIVVIVFSVVVVLIVFGIWYLFHSEAGKASSGIAYNIIDSLITI